MTDPRHLELESALLATQALLLGLVEEFRKQPNLRGLIAPAFECADDVLLSSFTEAGRFDGKYRLAMDVLEKMRSIALD